MLATHGLGVQIGSRHLLQDIGLDLSPGRVTAVLGPNGAGKSTLLHCLAGLRAPGAGAVLLEGRPVIDLPPEERARRIGFLPQQAALHWNIEVEALVALGRHPRRARFGRLGTADEAAIAQALARTDMLPFRDRLCGTLSGGELARALLARVLAGEPEWILADEPFAALDIGHRFDLAAQFRAIAATGTGVVVVLHDLALAGRLADDIVLIDGGRLVTAGPAAEVLASDHLPRIFGVAMERHVHSDGGISLVPSRRFP